jgi:hypothetical protein
MIIYSKTKARFLEDVDQNQLKNRLTDSFSRMTGSVPSDSRVWGDEYSRFATALSRARVEDEIQVALEYHITGAGRFRIDALLAGNDGQSDNGLIIELKAWERADVHDAEGMVFAPVGGGQVKEHPSQQANKYKGLILRFNQDVVEQGIGLHPAAYLFNLHRRTPEPLEDPRYQHILENSKLFLAGDVEQLRKWMEAFVPRKPRKNILFLLENGKLRPSNELIHSVSSMLDGNDEFTLLDEQEVAFQVIRHHLLPMKDKGERQVFVVEGGPGTGKSVIAVQLLAEIIKQGRMGFFVAPNRAFRETLVEHLARGNKGYREDGQALFHSSWNFHQENWDESRKFEILIVDEAHRLKSTAHMYKGKNMVDDLVRAARITVFFIDETQRVSWSDIGSIDEIRQAAACYGSKFNAPFQLKAQFRCNGSDSYLNWLDDCLGIRETAEFDSWEGAQYEFKVFDTAKELYHALQKRNGSNKARIVAGYSWEWPTKGRQRGTSLAHVQADGLGLPWNFDGENWATSKDGINQVGCIHTCQGLEFDWLGILIGDDLVYRDGQVQGDPAKRAKTDASLKGWKKALNEAGEDEGARKAVLDRVDLIIKSTYKVLLSRGRLGCYVWCADPALREYLKQRVARVTPDSIGRAPLQQINEAVGRDLAPPRVPFVPVHESGLDRYVNALPVVNLKFAAGAFGGTTALDQEEVLWVEPPEFVKSTQGMFIAQVIGESMNRRIPSGSWCLFRLNPGGTRNGKVVVAQHRSIDDPDLGGQYTIKVYRSEKTCAEDGEWRHERVTLHPDSTDPTFQPLVFTGEHNEVQVIAELVTVLFEAE